MSFKAATITATLLLSAVVSHTFAQVCANQFPCAECAVYDNNGNDLRGFIKSNKKDALYRGSKVLEYSDDSWGYLQIKNARIPSVDKKGNLNYGQYLNTTLALYRAGEGIKASWWNRQCNAPSGPLVYLNVNDEGRLDAANVHYTEITNALQKKKFAIVEYENDVYNQRDYDILLGNYILVPGGMITDVGDYKAIIGFYNNFLAKFSDTHDPFLGHKSFITFFTGNKKKYVGYFNVVNNKLAGKLEALDIQYEKDKETVVNDAFSKVTGTEVYVYGDNTFGLDKAFLKYGHAHHVKLYRRMTADSKKFNEDK